MSNRNHTGLGWLTVKARALVAAYKDAINNTWLYDGPVTSAAYLEASQELCKYIGELEHQVRSLKTSLRHRDTGRTRRQ